MKKMLCHFSRFRIDAYRITSCTPERGLESNVRFRFHRAPPGITNAFWTISNSPETSAPFAKRIRAWEPVS